MIDTTILGVRGGLETLRLERRENPKTRRIIAAAIAAFLALAVLA